MLNAFTMTKMNGDNFKSADLLGRDITSVRNLLGYWWVLDRYYPTGWGGFTYVFERAGLGWLDIRTDRKNRVCAVFDGRLRLNN